MCSSRMCGHLEMAQSPVSQHVRLFIRSGRFRRNNPSNQRRPEQVLMRVVEVNFPGAGWTTLSIDRVR